MLSVVAHLWPPLIFNSSTSSRGSHCVLIGILDFCGILSVTVATGLFVEIKRCFAWSGLTAARVRALLTERVHTICDASLDLQCGEELRPSCVAVHQL
ncbi:unnamed protein product [Citrullus colocynthis]|uniref:Uncharacterized protein n=1 Tax=Citrullus colocynthis TaxID=252529 RepID=A0ABP0XU26_9ROSI